MIRSVSLVGFHAPDEMLARVEGRVGATRAPAVRAFAAAYVRRLSEDDADADLDELLSEALGAFALADGRGDAPAAVRVLNPDRAADGYATEGAVVETNTDDLPFLVDSVQAEIAAQGLSVVRSLHPIVGTERAPDGTIARVTAPGDAPRTESVMHFEVDRRLDDAERAELERGVRYVLSDVARVVRDRQAMRDRTAATAERVRTEDPEVAAFLDWLLAGNLVLLGADGPEGAGLGLLDGVGPPPTAPEGDDLLHVGKTEDLSPVHRRARMDEILVRRPDGGADRILGLLTSHAYQEPATEIPGVRAKLQEIIAKEELLEGSHDHTAVVALFDSFPTDELLSAPTRDLRRAVVALLGPAGPAGVRVLRRPHPGGQDASVIVDVPRDRFDTELVGRLHGLMAERLGATVVDSQEVLGDDGRVRVHLSAHLPEGRLHDVPSIVLRGDVQRLVRSWEDRAGDALAAIHGPQGRVLEARWGRRLPPSYKAAVTPASAAVDIGAFDALVTSGATFSAGVRAEGDLTRIGLYRIGPKLELSEVMPILEHLGLHVIEERPTRLLGAEEQEMWLQDFGVLGHDSGPLDLGACGARVAATIVAVQAGRTESDPLHRLVVSTGMGWERLTILRALYRYRQRVGTRFIERDQYLALTTHSATTERILELFALRLDPAQPRDEDAEAALRAQIVEDLDAIASLDHDRILRRLLALVEAVVRTNAFRPDRDPTDPLAFKVRSGDVPEMPQPAPLFEIFVLAAGVEGIHLRGGRIARGGIRWSDRSDYRTEVFGLMRAQTVKNAVIVPDGAKGGFRLRTPPADPAALREEVERQYVTYISALLDLTDDLVDGAVVHPPGVRVLDEDDTYLVVAADKGTATFSDTANAIALERGFWLGDAFASGGSVGYDHKALGITARGAWESLKRLLSELDLDPAADPFTVVGIGDMSGDVFGNWMLLSDRIRLVGAYDHRHVFLDPDPDPDRGFAERGRLAQILRSTWDEYDRDAISEGGGVWPRTAKSIPLSPQGRAALGVTDAALAPSDLIRAMLRAPVDVLFNGGVGTVVKASAESDEDAHDRSSDAIRVDAADLRARLAVEGGNLGLTQRARIEFSAGGGRVNADFIDNSAGVDCSDHEVNLKILLDLAVRRGELDGPARDALLREVTDDVAAHVLRDSFLQAQQLSREVRASPTRMYAYEDLMSALGEAVGLRRRIEALPGSEDMADRRRSGRGMERPELAVLLAHAKRALTGALLDSGLPDDLYADGVLRGYFPGPVVARFGHLLAGHPLRRELVATLVANRVVDGMGPTFVSRLTMELGVGPAEIVRAHLVALGSVDAAARWQAIEALGTAVPRDVQAELTDGVDELVESTTRWNLRHGPVRDIATAVTAGRDALWRLAGALGEIGTDDWHADRDRTVTALVEQGVPAPMARDHAGGDALASAPAVAAVAARCGRTVEDVARAVLALDEQLGLAWVRQGVEGLPAGTRTRRWAQQALRDDLLDLRCTLAELVLADDPAAPVAEAVEGFLERRPDIRARLAGLTRTMAGQEAPELAGLALVVRGLAALAGQTTQP